MTTEAIFAEAMSLPAEMRAELVERLWNSLPANGAAPPRNELPKGVPIYGRGKGKLLLDTDDDSHLADFEESTT